MKRALLLPLLLASCDRAPDWSQGEPFGPLTIYGTLGENAFRPLAQDFARRHPGVKLHYVKLNASPLYDRYRAEHAAGHPHADLLIGSAMDLQVKLANDGYAATHRSANVDALPNWAKWRGQVFAVTLEPVVMVFNRTAMAGRALPQSRPQLLDALNADPAFWRGRVITYDIRTSSVGYLLASLDARQGFDFGSLMQAFRNVRLQTSSDTTAMFDAIEHGRAVMGYNLLGSYAWRRQRAGAPITIVYPHDYTLAVSRVALVPADAPHAKAAHVFLDFLLSNEGQRALVDRSQLAAVKAGVHNPNEELDMTGANSGPIRPVALGPGLLTYLDQQKRARLIEIWSRSTDALP
ncbi:ABC transporter substrate-binding protein [Sphingomonas sp. UYP23]